MNGRNDQSFSTAGSVPSSTPNHLSISGPLDNVSYCIDQSTWVATSRGETPPRKRLAESCHLSPLTRIGLIDGLLR